MNRRGFFKAALGGIAVSALPKPRKTELAFHKDAFSLVWPELQIKQRILYGYGVLRPEYANRITSVHEGVK